MRHNSDGSVVPRSNRFSIIPRLAFISSFLLPIQGFSSTPQDSSPSRYENVLSQKTLTVVAVEGDTTFFKEDRFLHGFGYDLARAYADDLKVNFKFKTARNSETALAMVKQGQADFAMTTVSAPSVQAKSLLALNVSCGDGQALARHGLNSNLSWVFKDADDPLAATASGFVCTQKQQGGLEKLAGFYDRHVINNYARKTFYNDIHARLPIYKASFQQTAKQHNLDWHLLAAIGYQESYLKPTSVSPTGVTGLMMLTQNTARAMGVADRTDPTQSIQGGAQYLRLMLTQYKAIPNPDQVWFALAAYNMGPGALDGVRGKVKRSGKNPNRWADVYSYLASHSRANSSYKQCITYVTRIRSYLETLKQNQSLARI